MEPYNNLQREISGLLEATKHLMSKSEDHESRLRTLEINTYKALGYLGAVSLLISTLALVLRVFFKI